MNKTSIIIILLSLICICNEEAGKKPLISDDEWRDLVKNLEKN